MSKRIRGKNFINSFQFKDRENLEVWSTFKALASQPIPLYGDGANVRDWLFVEDHIDALLLAATKGRLCRSYCIGGYGERTNKQVVESICKILDEISPRKRSYIELIN